MWSGRTVSDCTRASNKSASIVLKPGFLQHIIFTVIKLACMVNIHLILQCLLNFLFDLKWPSSKCHREWMMLLASSLFVCEVRAYTTTNELDKSVNSNTTAKIKVHTIISHHQGHHFSICCRLLSHGEWLLSHGKLRYSLKHCYLIQLHCLLAVEFDALWDHIAAEFHEIWQSVPLASL